MFYLDKIDIRYKIYLLYYGIILEINIRKYIYDFWVGKNIS